ncbi:porin family protein [Novosphingobium sp. 1949]|uniref:Porin family protein n=1 Tax=Novosphingobium organovorum TaxID=2930092 RepID=A0ABT0BGF2_9SPHN|nr:outer membrane beta-barrel protein [Novosphingobium organovorum]MCJ2183886.1 porin family protein [Novosphingobium organovorum]
MQKIALLAAGAALFAVPAIANAQAYVQVESGLDVAQQGGDAKAGFDYGVSAGYDYEIPGGMFVGVQGSYDDSTARSCSHNVYETGDRACLEAERDLAAVVRVGTRIGERNKVYVLGGYANTRVGATYSSASLSDALDGTGFTHLGAHRSLDGFRVGAGYQYDITKSLFVKAEYRYSNYSSDYSRHEGLIAVGTTF